MSAARCEWCGDRIAVAVGGGRRKKYCGQSCRQRAYEARAFGGRALLSKISAASGDRCALCGDLLDMSVKTGPECVVADHMIPASIGGPLHPENLHAVHARCNAAKGAAMFFPPAKKSA